MKLDLRPKKLIVKLGATNPEKITTVQQWFEVGVPPTVCAPMRKADRFGVLRP